MCVVGRTKGVRSNESRRWEEINGRARETAVKRLELLYGRPFSGSSDRPARIGAAPFSGAQWSRPVSAPPSLPSVSPTPAGRPTIRSFARAFLSARRTDSKRRRLVICFCPPGLVNRSDSRTTRRAGAHRPSSSTTIVEDTHAKNQNAHARNAEKQEVSAAIYRLIRYN